MNKVVRLPLTRVIDVVRKGLWKEERVEIVEIGPEDALQLLELNKHNRPISQSHVARLAEQMTDDKWMYNGDTLKFAPDGDCIDGQHRLWAIVESKAVIKTGIAFGVPKAAFSTVDTIRRNRSGADIIAVQGQKDFRREIAAALVWLWRYQNGAMLSKKVVEPNEIGRMFDNHPKINNAIEHIFISRRLFPAGPAGFAFYVFSELSNEAAEEFFQKIGSGFGYEDGEAVGQFRKYLQSTLSSGYQGQRDMIKILGLCFKAWNFSRRKETRMVLTFRTGPRGENFPKAE